MLYRYSIPFTRKRPLVSQGRDSAACTFSRQSGRRGDRRILMCAVVLGLVAPFWLHVCGSSLWQHSRQRAGVFLSCVHDYYLAFCMVVQAVRQTVTIRSPLCTGMSVASDQELASSGSRDNSDAPSWVDTCIISSQQFAPLWFIFCTSCECAQGGKHRASCPSEFFFVGPFSASSYK